MQLSQNRNDFIAEPSDNILPQISGGIHDKKSIPIAIKYLLESYETKGSNFTVAEGCK